MTQPRLLPPPPGGGAARRPDDPGAAFFDLDRTLMEGSSAFQFGRAAYRAGLVNRRVLLRDAYENVLFRLRGSTDAAQLLADADALFADADAALADGDLGTYQSKIDEARAKITEAVALLQN